MGIPFNKMPFSIGWKKKNSLLGNPKVTIYKTPINIIYIDSVGRIL